MPTSCSSHLAQTTRAPLSNDPRLEAALRRREQILATEELLDDDAVRRVIGSEPRDLRRANRLLGVWDGTRFLHPACQIDRNAGIVRPAVSELLALLPRERSGWRAAFWLFQPHALLEGRTPAELLASDTEETLAAARSSFDPGDTDW